MTVVNAEETSPNRQDPGSVDPPGLQRLQCVIGFLQTERLGMRANGNVRRHSKQVQPILSCIGRHALERPFVEQIAVIR